MNKILNKTIKGLRNLYTMQGKSAEEIESLIGQFITNYENSKAPQLVKSVPFVNSERLKELISSNDLETLKLLVGERDEARDAVKTASVESYVDSMGFKNVKTGKLVVNHGANDGEMTMIQLLPKQTQLIMRSE